MCSFDLNDAYMMGSNRYTFFIGRNKVKLEKLISKARGMLKSAGIDDSNEAEWVVALSLGIPFSKLFLVGDVSDKDVAIVLQNVRLRAEGMPVAYIVGNTEFFGRTFDVSEQTLVPRPETELLVEEVATIVKQNQFETILDIGTGSGAIAISLALETNARVTAVDISEGALGIAKKNAERLGANVEFVHSNLFENIEGVFDIIVSNPPYIKTSAIETLDREVKDHEPILALDGGGDGLEFYRKIIAEAPKYLRDGGVIAFEIGYDQGRDVAELLQNNFENIRVIKDYNKLDRIVIASER